MRNGLATGAMIAVLCTTGTAFAQDMNFGGDDDTAYAKLLWDVMDAGRLVGDNALYGFPYEGTDPHGALLETFYTEGTVGGHTGSLIVKRNYGPADAGYDDVIGNPGKHLAAITVMFQRESGYDDDNQNWYWVKYLSDGTLDKNPAGMELAGRVGKDADAGCIACHQNAGGDDYIFTTDASVSMMK